MGEKIMFTLETIEKQTHDALAELLEISKIGKGGICVIGCSSSEVCGGVIGKMSSPETADAIFKGAMSAASEYGVYIAAQCCEHLNRAIIVEKEAVKLPLECGILRPVNAVPQPKAGGSFATAAYKGFAEPIALENLLCDCGLDIGETLIGMHLKEVAVPVRLGIRQIGEARVTAARVRPKFIGGGRAVYDEKLM